MESRQFRLKKIKSQIRLFVPLALMIFSLILIGFGNFQSSFLSQFRLALIETIAPIGRFVSAPVRWGKNAVEGSIDLIQTYHDNKKLQIEIEELKEWKNLAIQLQTEQENLKKLLNYQAPTGSKYITAPVLLENGEQFSQSLIVQAGSAQGVQKGDIAMTANGVLGRVIEVGQNMSRLMLLTDYASRVPVRIGQGQVLGILAGDNSKMPKMTALPENQTISVGDVVLTSGQVGVFPAGLAIGVVASTEEGDIKVLLFEKDQTPAFVRLFNFGLKDVLLSQECVLSKEN